MSFGFGFGWRRAVAAFCAAALTVTWAADVVAQGDTTATANAAANAPGNAAAPVAASTVAAIVDLERAREEARVTMMVKPDRRFVRAAEFIIQRLGSEGTSDTIQLVVDGERWQATIGGKTLGHLEQFGTFDENLKFVEAVAKEYIEERKAAGADDAELKTLEKEASEKLGAELLEVGRKIDEVWGDEAKPLPLHAATKASLYLLMQCPDSVGVGDEISARAIAFLAAESALTDAKLVREKALLAQFLQYFNDACVMSHTLADNDVIKHYLLNKTAELNHVANRADATLATWYLAARLAATNRDEEGLQAIFERKSSVTPETHLLALSPLVQYLAEWDGGAQLALQMAGELTMEVSGRKGDMEDAFKDGETLVPVFVKGLEEMKAEGDGPFVDRQLVLACYETAFCNCIDFAMDFYINRYGSLEDSRQLVAMLGTAAEGPVGEYSRVLDARVNETGEGKSTDKIIKMLGELKYVNADQAHRFFNKVGPNYQALMPEPVRAGVEFMKVLDGRPEVYGLIELLFTDTSFRNLEMAEKVFEALATPECPKNKVKQAYLQFFRGEREKLLKTLEDPEIPDSTRAMYVATYLDKDPTFTTETLDQKIKDLAARNPNHNGVISWCVDYLSDQERYDEAIEISTKYAESQAMKNDLSYPHARTDLAELYAAKGDNAKALEISKSVVESYTAASLLSMSMYSTALGKYDDGLEWAQKALERYESSAHSLGSLVYCYWAQGKYAEAADAIDNFEYPISSGSLRSVFASYFLKALGDKPAAEREKALAELERIGMGERLGDMAYYFRGKERFDLLFEFMQHVKETGYQKHRANMISYNALRLDKGTSEALAWLKQVVPVGEYGELGPLAFRESEYELLDTLVPYDDATTQGRYNWTLRAAAVCADEAMKARMGERVKQYFAAKKSGDFHHAAGRYMLGLADVAELQGATASADDVCQAACYLALRARAEGKYRDASDWLQVSLLSGREELNEYHKARLILAGWGAIGRSLDIMEEVVKAQDKEVPGM